MIERTRCVSHTIFLLALAIAAFALTSATPVYSQDSPAVASARSENAFGLSLLRAVDDHAHNVFISPLSIGQAMTMLYDGAGGATRDQIAKAMDLGGLDGAAVNSGAQELRQEIVDADPKCELSIANALWADNRIAFRASYTRECLSALGAQATSLHFKDPSAAQTINSWVSRNTKGKIKSIVSSGSIRGAGAVLTDAVYFHGVWTHTFDTAGTRAGAFTLGSGVTTQLPMMHQTHLLAVLQNDRFQAVRLPYGGGRISMVIVLPRSGRTLDSLASELTTGEWSDWMTSMSAATVDLTVPRFHIEYAAGLVDALKSIGVTDAFEGRRADFGPMSETPMFVSDVVHKTTFDVDEAGTTATAATAITMMPTLAAPRLNPPIVIRVDHPFLCAIQDDQTGALIFVGLIRDPQGAK